MKAFLYMVFIQIISTEIPNVPKFERETTYEKIKHQWVELCNEVVLTCKNTCIM